MTQPQREISMPEMKPLIKTHYTRADHPNEPNWTEAEALELLISADVAHFEQNPANIEFHLSDGRILTYWRDSYDYGDAWELEERRG